MLLTGASLLSGAWTNNNQQEINLPGLMLAKLTSTQRVVTGLVSKNFGEIKRGHHRTTHQETGLDFHAVT